MRMKRRRRRRRRTRMRRSENEEIELLSKVGKLAGSGKVGALRQSLPRSMGCWSMLERSACSPEL